MAQPKYLSHTGVHHFSHTGANDHLAHTQQPKQSPLAWGGTLLPPVSEERHTQPAPIQHRHVLPLSPSGHAEVSTTAVRKPLKLKIKFPSKQKVSETSVPTTPSTAFQQLERIAAACAKEADLLGPLPAEYDAPLAAPQQPVEITSLPLPHERPATAPAAAHPSDHGADRKRRKRKSPEQAPFAELQLVADTVPPAHSSGDAAWRDGAKRARPATAPPASAKAPAAVCAEPAAAALTSLTAAALTSHTAAAPPAAALALQASLQQGEVLQKAADKPVAADTQPDERGKNDIAPDAGPEVLEQQPQQAPSSDRQPPAPQQQAPAESVRHGALQHSLAGHKRAPSAEPDSQPEPCKLRPGKRHKPPAHAAAPERKPLVPHLPDAMPDAADTITLHAASRQSSLHCAATEQQQRQDIKAVGAKSQELGAHMGAGTMPQAAKVQTAEVAVQTDEPVQPATPPAPRAEGTDLEAMLALIGALSGSDIVGNRSVEQFSNHARHFKKQGDSMKEMQQPDQQQAIMVAYAKAGLSFLLQSFALEQRLTDNRIKRQQVVAMYESTSAWLESTARQAARTDEPVQHLARLLITRMGAVAQLRATWLARTALQDDCRQVEAVPSRRPSPLGGLSNPPSPPLPTPAGMPVLMQQQAYQQQQQHQRQTSWGSGNGSAGAARRSTTPVPTGQKANGKGQLQGPTPTAGSPGSNNSTNSATSAHGLGVAALPNGQAAKAAEQPQAAAMHLSGGMKRMLKASETLKVTSSEIAVLGKDTESGQVKQALCLLSLMALDGMGGELRMTMACASRALESICKLQNAGA